MNESAAGHQYPHPFCSAKSPDAYDCHQSISSLRIRGEDICIVPQNLTEFWAVATRPQSANGLAMTTAQTEVELARLKSFFRFLKDNAMIHDEWRSLLRNEVSGKNTYDARLVAAMSVHGITTLLTFNGADFKRFQGISVISPADVR